MSNSIFMKQKAPNSYVFSARDSEIIEIFCPAICTCLAYHINLITTDLQRPQMFWGLVLEPGK